MLFPRRPRLIAHTDVLRGSPLSGRYCYAAMMDRRCFRGMILDYRGDPRLEAGAVRFEADGLLVVKDGMIEARGDYQRLHAAYPGVPVVDLTGKLLLPGFIDSHVHFPQIQMIASPGEQLLHWLNHYTFPSELAYENSRYSAAMAEVFIRELLRHGTTTALTLCSVHPSSVDSLAHAAQEMNLRLILGKVLMDRNAPPALCDTPERAYDESKALIQRWHQHERLSYAVTPRFAATSSPEQLEAAGCLLQEFPDVYLHSHLAENQDEIAWVRSLFPERDSYTDVYAHHGLLTPRSIFAHGIHLAPEELEVLAAAGSALAFCPTSNLFLGSGLFRYSDVRSAGVPVALGSDVGAGTSFSMLRTLSEAYKVLQLQNTTLTVHEGLYLATLGSAAALRLDSLLGNFEPGKEADFVVLDPESTPLLALRNRQATSVEEMLFGLMILGDDRAVFSTHVQGVERHRRDATEVNVD